MGSVNILIYMLDTDYVWIKLTKFRISSQAIDCLSTNWADSVHNTKKTIWLILKLFENILRKNWMNDNNKKCLMLKRERWERYDDKWRKGRTGKFTTPKELVSLTFPAKSECLKCWWSWLVVVIRQHCRPNICRSIAWVYKYWYLTVSEAKFQITLLIVRRGALSSRHCDHSFLRW